MNSIYQHYIIDLSSNNNFVQIPTVQGDGNNIRGFEVELIQNGIQYVIDRDDTIISIVGTKPDTKQIMNYCGLTDEGYILVDITSQMSAVKGRGDYQIIMFSKSTNSQLKSFPFYILTTSAVFDADYITSSDEFQALTRNIVRSEKAIEDANQVVSDIRDLEDAVENAENARADAEKDRADAEISRESSEIIRNSNEATRIANEINRQNAEKDRNDAENIRISNENTRITNENTRISNENTRILNEKNRQDTEKDRSDAESDRIAAENVRTASENIRIANENARETAETARGAAETNRDNAENVRISNENTRQNDESTRQQNEITRQNNETVREANEIVRKSNETARDNAETARESNETARKNAESARTADENTRIQNENARITAETERISEETKRNNAEIIRIDNESTRQSSESVRQSNESARQADTAAAISDAETAIKRANDAAEACEEIAGGNFIPGSEKGVPEGVATLDSDGKVPKTQLPSDIGSVTGVKGSKETEYRTGDVNIDPEDIGALPLSGGIMDEDSNIVFAASGDNNDMVYVKNENTLRFTSLKPVGVSVSDKLLLLCDQEAEIRIISSSNNNFTLQTSIYGLYLHSNGIQTLQITPSGAVYIFKELRLPGTPAGTLNNILGLDTTGLVCAKSPDSMIVGEARKVSNPGVGSGWSNGRDNAVVRMTGGDAVNLRYIASIKTVNGSWDIGAYGYGSSADKLLFCYVTDSDYNNSIARVSGSIAFTSGGIECANVTANTATAGSVALGGAGAVPLIYTENENINFRFKRSAGGAVEYWSIGACLSAVQAMSSRRYKKNINPMTEELAKKILEIEVVSYDYKDGFAGSEDQYNQTGVIAEDVFEIIPNVVIQAEIDGELVPDRINYARFAPYLIKLVQIQQKEIDSLKEDKSKILHRLERLEEALGIA